MTQLELYRKCMKKRPKRNRADYETFHEFNNSENDNDRERE